MESEGVEKSIEFSVRDVDFCVRRISPGFSSLTVSSDTRGSGSLARKITRISGPSVALKDVRAEGRFHMQRRAAIH